jgi:DNA-binding NarL/FixJ family response regulator
VKEPKVRVLVVDDYAPWCQFVTSTLRKHPEFIIVGEASDGLAAVSKAQELQPDLVLLDIGLPKLNGIEAARQIRKLASSSKILFITENNSRVIAEEALRTGASGYILKSDAARELMPAIRAVLQGKQFVSARFAGRNISDASNRHIVDAKQKAMVTPLAQKTGTIQRHEVGFYSDDHQLLDHVSRFIAAALKAGSGAVVVATEAHRDSLVARLLNDGVDIDAAIRQGRYLAVDAAESVASYMANGTPDPDLFMEGFCSLIERAAKAVKGGHPRVAVFGEGVDLLCGQGNLEAALQVESLGNQLTNLYDVDILCGYSSASVQGGMYSPAFQRICAEHSAAYSYFE